LTRLRVVTSRGTKHMSSGVGKLLVVNRKVVQPCQFNTLNDFITAVPPGGVYTTCRTFGQTAIIDLSAQLDRLEKIEPKDRDILHEALVNCLAVVVHHFKALYQNQKDTDSETRITISATRTNDDFRKNFAPTMDIAPEGAYDFCAFGEVLPPIPKPPVLVAIKAGERRDPQTKSTQWAHERLQYLEGEEGANDVVLMHSDGNVTEGLSSNFGVVVGKTVYTAPPGEVLAGTMLEHVLMICKELGITVKRECPNIKDFDNWDAAFISSTSRLLLPINRLKLSTEHRKICREMPDFPLFKEINDKILASFKASATQVAEPTQDKED